MSTSLLTKGEAYLAAWKDKDLKRIAAHIHPKVQFKGPMTELSGSESFLSSCEMILPMLKDLKVRSKFASENQAIFTYDFVCQEPIGVCRTAELLTFEDEQIKSIELFFDALPFEKLKRS